MSVASEPTKPEVPGVWRLMWLLCMQPIKLRHMFKAWDLEWNPGPWTLYLRSREAAPYLRTLTLRLLVILLVIAPAMTLIVCGALSIFVPVNWETASVGLAVYMALGLVAGGVLGVVFAVVLSISGALAVAALSTVNAGIISWTMAGAAPVCMAAGAVESVGLTVVFGVVMSIVASIFVGKDEGIMVGVAAGVATVIVVLRIPLFSFETLATRVMSTFGLTPAIARWLPYRHDDLIYFPLPGLHRILTAIGLRDPLLARQLIDEATASIAQGKPARRALDELQAHALEKAARDEQWSAIANLQGPFFPLPDTLDAKDPLLVFVNTAKDIQAAETGGAHHRRRNQLESARKRLESFQLAYATQPGSRPEDAEIGPIATDGDVHELENGTIEELARVLHDPEDAIMVLRRADYPPGRIPPFKTPSLFWAKVVGDARNGVLRDGARPLIDAAAELFPSNPIFARHRDALSPKRSPPAEPKLQPARRHEDPRAIRLQAVAAQWSTVLSAKIDELQQVIAKSPEIPAVYITGSPLDPTKPEEVALFRVRRDLVIIIDRDLDDDRRGPLLLTGQRRMGKTSLLRMLPTHLGATTTIATVDFQALSGSDFRHAPHRWVAQSLATALAQQVPDLAFSSPDAITDAWGTALDWLKDVDTVLARANQRALVTIDEIERLQDGANEGWGNLTFLDFVRAAGDALRRIRLLLVSAHQLTSPRLGPKWPDRLISAFSCHIGPLPREDAEQLLRKPVHYFPTSVFDDAAVAAVLAQTGGHPYLIQVVGDQIVKRLNGGTPRRTTATPHDIDRALDGASTVARQVFSDLWQDFDDTDRTLLRTLAHDQPIDPNTASFRSLRDQSFVELRDGGTPAFVFPLFARWIRDYQS